MFHAYKALFLGLGLVLPLLTNAAPTCSDLTIPVTVQAEVKGIVIPPLGILGPNVFVRLLFNVLGAVGLLWPVIPVGGTYNIRATYCEPQEFNDANAVQLLAHGGTYNRRYWTGLGLPEGQAEQYSWAHFAAEKGYATLSIDRLGAGGSTRPDPVLEVQISLQSEIVHEIVGMLRGGEIGGRAFSKVIYAGHSLGSLLGVAETKLYPGDFDALILTGWSANLLDNFAGILSGLLLPASVVLPQRFPGLHPAYLVFSNKAAMTDLFYGPDGTFDPTVRDHDWANRDTAAAGELVTLFAGQSTSPYAGPILVLTGEFDAAFCSPGGTCSPGPNNVPGNSAALFPQSNDFNSHIVPGAAHCLNLLPSAPETFAAAHDFLYEYFEA